MISPSLPPDCIANSRAEAIKREHRAWYRLSRRLGRGGIQLALLKRDLAEIGNLANVLLATISGGNQRLGIDCLRRRTAEDMEATTIGNVAGRLNTESAVNRIEAPAGRLRTADLLGTLSLAADLAVGLPAEHAVRSCYIGMRINAS